MTITSDPVSPLIDEPDTDLLPGSSDVEWAERAYRHRPEPPSSSPPKRRRTIRDRHRHFLRNLLVALVIVAAVAGLTVALTTQGASSPTTTQSHSSIAPPTGTLPGSRPASITHAVLTPPLLRPMPFSVPILTAPKR